MEPRGPTRRTFLGRLRGLAAFFGAVPASGAGEVAGPPRRPGARFLGDHAAPPLRQVRIALIGVGARGALHAEHLAQIEGVRLVALCDLHPDLVRRVEHEVGRHGHRPKGYSGDANAWRRMLAEVRPDAVYVSTPWELHAEMGVAAMEAGAHAFVEIPLALTLADLWRLADTAEQTGRHCMMLENVPYGREELLYLNMVRQGVIGELLHGEAAYIHDLREQLGHLVRGPGSWRTAHHATRNGNLYPTHGLGPIAQYMSLGRGEDNFDRLVSLSSPSRGRRAYAEAHFRPGYRWRGIDFAAGDINTSIIRTRLGRTILVQWDETSPRPSTRLTLIQGTKGTLARYPNRLAIEGRGDPHEWAEGLTWERVVEPFEHPLYRRAGALARRMGGHGGMDFLMNLRVVECLRRGEPLDQNVYEGCFWSAVAPLSEKSVAEGGAPQAFPDFTRGDWRATLPLGIVS